MQLEEYIIGGGSRLASAKGGGRWEAASNCRRSKLTAEGCHWVWGGEGGEQGERKLGGVKNRVIRARAQQRHGARESQGGGVLQGRARASCCGTLDGLVGEQGVGALHHKVGAGGDLVKAGGGLRHRSAVAGSQHLRGLGGEQRSQVAGHKVCSRVAGGQRRGR